jgi:hypothetical protein
MNCPHCGSTVASIRASGRCGVCDSPITTIKNGNTGFSLTKLRYTYLFNDVQVFGDNTRERDNIIWKAPKNAFIFPLYMDGKCGDGSRSVPFEELGASSIDDDTGVYRFKVMERKMLEKDFFMHDDNLHGIHLMPGTPISWDLRNAVMMDGMVTVDDIKYYGIDAKVAFFGSLYAYKFPNPFSTEHGWTVGFLIRAENVLAHDVDMIDDDTDET